MTRGLPPGVLQVGYGAFGPVHLEAWLRLGLGDRLWLADPDPAARARAAAWNLPAERVVADFETALDRVAVVDVLTATPAHAAICEAALAAGLDVFCEKPLTIELDEAERLATKVAATGRVLQVGYYFRQHPLFRHARERIAAGDLGELRYLAGTFAGFKRARADMGVTASDAVHFLDYFGCLTGCLPERVFALRRDHFGRGLDDLALILLEYPGSVVGKVEAGLIQPGRHVDLITPGALTTKEVALCGAEGAIEIDFPLERLTWHRVRHELQDGLWRPVSRTPASRACRPPPRSTSWRASSGSSSGTSRRAPRPRPMSGAAGSTSRACWVRSPPRRVPAAPSRSPPPDTGEQALYRTLLAEMDLPGVSPDTLRRLRAAAAG